MNFGDFEERILCWKYRDFEVVTLVMDDIDFNAPVIDRKLGDICSNIFYVSEIFLSVTQAGFQMSVLTQVSDWPVLT